MHDGDAIYDVANATEVCEDGIEDAYDDVDCTEVAETDNDTDILPEHQDDKIQPPEDSYDLDLDDNDNNNNKENNAVYTNCTGGASCLFNMERAFPDLYGDSNYADSSDSF